MPIPQETLEAISSTHGADMTKLMRKALKSQGVTSMAVSVTCDSFSMGSSFTITLKDPRGCKDFSLLEQLKDAGESIDRCDMTGEILNGGNTYGHLKISKEAEAILREPFISEVEEAISIFKEECPSTLSVGDWEEKARSIRSLPKGFEFYFSDRVSVELLRGDEQSRALYCADHNGLAKVLSTEISTRLYKSGEHPCQKGPDKKPLKTIKLDGEPVGYTVERRHHTKKDVDFWLISPGIYLDSEKFNEVRKSCKSAGGWYSRAYAGQSGGFAFPEDQEHEAITWAEAVFAGNCDAASEAVSPAVVSKVRERARGLAEKSEAYFAQRAENTPKRQAQASSARVEGSVCERMSLILSGWADSAEAGTLPEEVRSVPTLEELKLASSRKLTRASCGFSQLVYETNEWRVDTPNARALRGVMGCEAKDRTEEIQKAKDEAELRNSQIPGFFPTPPDVVDHMLDIVGDGTNRALLDPECGKGDILERALS